MVIVSIPCLFTKQKTKKKKSWNDGLLKVQSNNGGCKLYDNAGGKKIGLHLLEATTLTKEELQVALKGEEIEVEFESFLVMVDADEAKGSQSKNVVPVKSQQDKNVKSGPKQGLVLAPFKAPSRITQVAANEDDDGSIEASRENGVTRPINNTIAKFSSRVGAGKPVDFSRRYEGTTTAVAVTRGAVGTSRGSESSAVHGAGGGEYAVDDDELDELWGEEEEKEEQRIHTDSAKDGYNFGVDGREHLVPAAKEDAAVKRRKDDNRISREEFENLPNAGLVSRIVPAAVPAVAPFGAGDEDLWGETNPAQVVIPAAAPAATSTDIAAAEDEDLWSF